MHQRQVQERRSHVWGWEEPRRWSREFHAPFEKRMKMTQGKDWWSQGRSCWRPPTRRRERGGEHECEATGPPLILYRSKFRGEHLPQAKRTKPLSLVPLRCYYTQHIKISQALCTDTWSHVGNCKKQIELVYLCHHMKTQNKMPMMLLQLSKSQPISLDPKALGESISRHEIVSRKTFWSKSWGKLGIYLLKKKKKH